MDIFLSIIVGFTFGLILGGGIKTTIENIKDKFKHNSNDGSNRD